MFNLRLIVIAAVALCLAACGNASLVAPPPVTTTASAADAAAPVPIAVTSTQRFINLLETDGPAKINADLDAATAYAATQGDLLGASCYPAVKAWLATLPPLPAGALATRVNARPPPAGLVTGFEYARVDRTAVEGSVNAWRTQVQTILTTGLSQPLELGCGGLIADERGFALRIAALIGVGATTASLAPVLPGLGPLLPIPITP